MNNDVGRLISFKGIVTRTGERQIFQSTESVKCSSCSTLFDIQFDVLSCKFIKPDECGKVSNNITCKGKKFVQVEKSNTQLYFINYIDPKEYRDFQEILVQELTNSSKLGFIPRLMKL